MASRGAPTAIVQPQQSKQQQLTTEALATSARPLKSPTLTISPPPVDDEPPSIDVDFCIDPSLGDGSQDSPVARRPLSSYSSQSSDEEVADAAANAAAGLTPVGPRRLRPASCIGQEHFSTTTEEPCCESATLCLQMDPQHRGARRRQPVTGSTSLEGPSGAVAAGLGREQGLDSDVDEEDEVASENGTAGAQGSGSPASLRPGSAGKTERSSPLSRIFGRPLQRSRSTGCNAEPPPAAQVEPAAPVVPPHALFLKEKPAHAPKLHSASPKYSRKTPLHGSASGLNAQASNDSVVYEGEKSDRKKKKNVINIDVREKLSFFRRQTDVALINKAMQLKEAEKLLKTSKPDLDQVLRWGSSFDALLNDKYGLALFRGFLRTEFSDENIEFWIACEEYKTITGSRKLASRAQKIYNDYIAVQAPREVNLDSKTRLQTITNISNPDKHTFDQAQKRIQALMDKDSYQRFLRSDLYLSLRRDCIGPGGASSSGGASSGATSSRQRRDSGEGAKGGDRKSPSAGGQLGSASSKSTPSLHHQASN